MKIIQFIVLAVAITLISIRCYLGINNIFPFAIDYLIWMLLIVISIGNSSKPIFAIATLLIALLGIAELTVLKDMKVSNPNSFEMFYPLYVLLYHDVDILQIKTVMFNDTVTSFIYYVVMSIYAIYKLVQHFNNRIIKHVIQGKNPVDK